MNENKLNEYLKKHSSFKSVEEFKKLIEDNNTIDRPLFTGWETGMMEFNKSKSGRRYIQALRPPRFYLD